MKRLDVKHSISLVIIFLGTVSICFAQGENWKKVSNMPIPRFWASSCVVAEKIYLKGGVNTNNNMVYNTVTVFDPGHRNLGHLPVHERSQRRYDH